jgi:hypothetical protein
MCACDHTCLPLTHYVMFNWVTFACLCVAVCNMGTYSLEQDVNGMGQLHFAAIGDDTGKIEWLVPARHFVFYNHEAFVACACAPCATACLMPTH